MYSWAVSTVVDYFNRKGREVFGCAMYLSKAFDMIVWVVLFRELLNKGIAVIFLRVILSLYKNQTCDVRWNNKYSHRFSVTNGVRQGAISSPILFCIYIDKLVRQLREQDIGCHIFNKFVGVWVYADDIIILSSSRMGLQSMISTCEQFADKYHLKFSTNIIEEK